MAKRKGKEIIWAATARHVFYQTLAFWAGHNKSNSYSKKLEKEIAGLLKTVSL